jgi:hypothetical protein
VPNPYVHGSPIAAADADAFADRAEELATLDGALGSGGNVILLAPRRYGKTSLLNIAVARALANGVRAGRVTLADCTDLQDVCESLLHGILEGPARWRERGADAVRELVGHLRPRLEVSSTGSLRVLLDVEPGRDPWRRMLLDVLRVLDALRASGDPVALVIDEFQRAYELDDAVPGAIKRLCDEMPAVSLVLSGSRRHLMERISGHRAPLARVGTRIALPKVPRAEMCDFLVRRAAAGGKMLALDVAERIHDRAAGVPNEVQQLASQAYDQAPGNRIRGRDVDEALARIVRQGRFEYVAILHRPPALGADRADGAHPAGEQPQRGAPGADRPGGGRPGRAVARRLGDLQPLPGAVAARVLGGRVGIHAKKSSGRSVGRTRARCAPRLLRGPCSPRGKWGLEREVVGVDRVA